jgi:ABC-type transport system involved in cytochrome c biogenesis ATPase subunit
MLVEFAVANFRSIKDEARLSLVASADKRLEASNLAVKQLAGRGRPIRVLRSAAIYGANASGKTNLLRGLGTMHDIVRRSSGNLDELPVTPFRFDPGCQAKPSTFEVVCIVDDVRYQYGFSATRHEVLDEWLYAWPSGKMQVWFERTRGVTPGTSTWTLGGKLTGDRQVWRRATRPRALFLSTAVALNSVQLLPLFNWFRERLVVIVGYREVSPRFSLRYCEESERSEIVDFLAASDLAVTDIRIVERGSSPDAVAENGATAALGSEIREDSIANAVDVLLQHQPDSGEPAELDISEESDGTRKMFALAGPWLDSLTRGNVIVLDELHDNLHPELVRFLVAQFHDPAVSRHGAQLIFSTHDTSILDRNLLRRDQIWLCGRDERLETSVVPLSDFRTRHREENLEQAYRAGRFGAVPYVRRSRHDQSDSD